jgi:hypothetical protein
MKAHVNKLVVIRDSYYRGPRGLKTFRCKYVLNVFFHLGLSSPFSFESRSYAVFLVPGHIPWHGVQVEIL